MASTMAVHATFCWNGTVSRGSGNGEHTSRVIDIVSALSYHDLASPHLSSSLTFPLWCGHLWQDGHERPHQVEKPETTAAHLGQ